MILRRDERGNFSPYLPVNFLPYSPVVQQRQYVSVVQQWQSAPVVQQWRYQPWDWVMLFGFPNHHLRIVEQRWNGSVRWYWIFDTRLGSHGEYSWRRADELDPEHKSVLIARATPDQIPGIRQRTEQCHLVGYSFLARTDCESIQRWIQTGKEGDRWSPQVVAGAGAGLLALGLIFGSSKTKH